VPAKFGKGHTADAVFLLGLIATLMLADSLFAASNAAGHAQRGQPAEALAVLSLPWIFQIVLGSVSLATLWHLNIGSYLVHELTFYFLLCYRPFGIQFHVETSLFSVYFAKLERGTLKPVRWGISDEHLDKVKSFGVKKFEDFTWKHMLDFYSCADCGRCADNCPANAVGRPLAPRFLTIKARDYAFQHYPVLGKANNNKPLIGSIYSEDEIWSCTTCGACEEECPLLVEYIDKIVDLRRGMIDDGNVPQSLQKPLKALESRGNPYGKLEKKRGEWTKTPEFQQTCGVKVLDGKNGADTLYFVDSITSYDDRMQSIGRATARILSSLGKNFGILGAAERDSGHEVRRFGEEMLFMALRDHNTDAIKALGVQQIVTADPHAYNALKHDYKDVPPVEHISQVIAREVKAGKIEFNPVENENNVYAYHDPCYLGRHNQVYGDPRNVLDAIPGLKRVEMKRSRDRSFCCGGGGLMLFYEPKEEQRMGVVRVRMAAEAGANVIVTACPFCMVNIEDAIKVAGLEGKMAAIDLAELVDQQMTRESCTEQIETATCGG
jgi:Fe-S oxidoreductase